MDDTMPILLVPGLACSSRIFAPVMPALWRFGPVTVANHIRDDNMGAIARRILAEAPPRFALAGHSMGGYIAFEIMRQAAGARGKARADQHPGATGHAGGERAPPRADGARGEAGEFRAVLDELFPGFVHPSRQGDAALRQLVHDMGEDVGAEAFVRQQTAVIGRVDFAAVAGLDQVPDFGALGRYGQHHPQRAVKGDGRRHSRRETRDPRELRPPSASRNSRRPRRPRWLSGCEASCFRRRRTA